MTVPHDTTYPVNATNKTWQAKKTVGDKMLTKTGLGAKLTDAETKWKAIPWADLDITKHTIGTVEAAEAAQKKAQAAQLHVNTALAALKLAYDDARATAATKGLSSKSKAAADAAVTALTEARKRLALISITEFQTKVDQLKAPAKMSSIEVHSGRDYVAKATGGTWDRKELKLTGVTWLIGKADDYKGKTLSVFGHMQSPTNDASDFRNDMKIESASGSNATFKS